MSIAELLLPEFEQEMSGVRRVLERIPNDKLSWKAHEKSNTIGWLANHLAEIPGWVQGTLSADEWDIDPVDGEPYRTPNLSSREAILEELDKNVAAAKASLAATGDETFAQSWSLLKQGNVMLTMPKLGVIRTWVINHSIHHRGIMTVYLRLNDIPVPGLYGPSGDE
jgi:uncharacterized damage-inducible protein DinB